MSRLNWNRPNGGYEQEPWQKAYTPVKLPKIKRLGKHSSHNSKVIGPKGPHAGGLYCVECDKLICWLTPEEYKIAKEI
jgi:hypothetical protein